jgi:GGDEF domain-containing protein
VTTGAPERRKEMQRELARLEQAVAELTVQLGDARTELQKARVLAALDPRTGLLVERALQERLAYEVARAARFRREVSFLLVRSDANPRGEGSLVELADLCRATIRATDLLGISAPDEIAVILPETPGDGALVLAARLGLASRQRSFGCAVFPRDARTPAELVAAARRALRTGCATTPAAAGIQRGRGG